MSTKIEEAVAALRTGSFNLAGASFGSVLVSEDPRREHLKHIADTRMYENKRTRRASTSAEWLRKHYVVPVQDLPPARTSRPRG